MSLKGTTNQQRLEMWKTQNRGRMFVSKLAEAFFLPTGEDTTIQPADPFAIMWSIGNPQEYAGMLKHQIYFFHNKTFVELDTKGGRLEAINFIEIVAKELKDGAANKNTTTIADSAV